MTNQNAAFFLPIKIAIAICILTMSVTGQTSSATDGSTPLGLQPGAPAGSYALSDFDNVNLYNGSLSFQLSLLGLGGRGATKVPVMLPIEGKWRVLDLAISQPDGSFNHHYMPVQSWWENNDRKYRPGSVVARQGDFDVMTCPDNTNVNAITLTRLTFTSPDGTEYELRDQLTGGQPANNTNCNYLNPPSRGRVFVTSDGSAATFVSDTTIYDYVINPNPSSETFPSGYLMLRDGTRFRVEGGSVTWMRDRNGNKFIFGYDSNHNIQTITDSLNRVVTISRNTGPGTFDQITCKGFGGAQRIIKVNYSSLASALRSDYLTTRTYKSLFPELDGSTTTLHNPSVISSITLPNTQQYFIRYNQYGEIARVVLPTGGAIEYDYAAGVSGYASGAFGGGYEGSWVVYRRVTERRVYPDGGTGSTYVSRMTYTQSSPGIVTVDQLNNSGALLTRSKHYFHGNAATSFGLGPIDYSGWKESREYQTEEYASNGTTLLRRTVNTWEQPIATSTWPLTQPETNSAVKTNNPQITQTVNTVEPAQANKVSKQTFGYDKYTNQTDVYEYDFGPGAAGPLVRRTHTDYLASSYDTLNPSATNPDLNLTSHIRNLPTQISVFDAAGVERARSTTEYDNYVLDGADCLHSFHCPLQSRANMSGFDSVFSSSYTKRGNPTRSTRHLLSSGSVTGSVSAYSHYDVAGNLIRAIDPRSTSSNYIVTGIEYDDRFGTPDNEARANSAPSELTGFASFAFPTKLTNSLGHTSYAQFDYYLGQPVNGEDANGVVAAGYFNDQLDRPTQIRRAIGTAAENQTTFAYDDALRLITTRSDKDVYGDDLLVSKIKYDQLGRTSETRQYEGGDNYIVTVTQYDALSRPFKTSNPYRPWQSETAVWTTQGFDALGRVVSVTTPDNAVVSTSYSGNNVTVTDQAGKARKSVTDALGRLTDVYEDPNGAGYRTTYAYDVLDNLTTVTQGIQTRTFGYDSLKRLRFATNPESGTVTYEYDDNSNLRFKTDPRGVVTENRYDALNRVTTILYRINGQPDPNTGDIEYLYDNATNGKGRLWLTYRWGAKPSHTAVGLYDAMGRVTQLYNLFGDGQGGWSTGYAINRSYNRAGAVTSQTYPSGHTVTYNYDSAGRLADKDAQNLAFTGNLGDGVQRTYSRGTTYTPAGQLKQEQFGTATPVFNKLFYNSRLQLAEILTSTTANDSSWNRGKILNQYSLQCSGAGCNATDNNGNLRKQEMFIPVDDQVSRHTFWYQQYDYDTLNRLQRVHEYTGNPQLDWQQEFLYDQWGNRRIDAANTYGAGINNRSFEKQDTTNRLYAPGDIPLADSLRRIRYDAAGNQIKDTYTGYGAATFDADNRIVAIQDAYASWSYYTYNADGQRVRRKINNQETWQIYGIDGELLAEYAVNGTVGTLQKEYGYRNGQLVITAKAPAAGSTPENVSWTNVVGASVSGNSLTKTATTAWGNAGAASTKSIVSGDGYVEFQVTSLYTGMVALSHTDANQDYTTMEFAFLPNSDGNLYVFESGVNRGVVSSYTTSDMFRIAVEGGVVKYRKNGTLVYTSTVTPTYPLLVDAGLYHNGGTQSNVMISGNLSGGSSANVQWLISDHLGTPRLILDETGTLANVRRHDYLPFGDELFAGTGARTTANGYVAGDGLRQQFTSKERDVETGLDYFGARYFASVQGRFTSPDPLLQSGRAALPQSWNRYAYVLNSPLRLIDTDGLADTDANEEEQKRRQQQNQQQQQPQVVDLRKDKIITAEINKIQADVKPLPEGVTPVLSDVRVVVGETVSVNNGTLIDGYGNYTEGFTGVVRPVAYIPLNQNGNIIEGNGVAVQENVKVTSGDKPRTTEEPAPLPKGGVFIDTQLLAAGRPTTTIQQAVFVGQFPRSGGAANPVFRIGVNEITKNADKRTVSVKLGPTQRVR